MAKQVNLTAVDGSAPLWRLDVADSWLARLRGLIGRRSLAAGEGLYLPGTNGVHMFFMGFAIDVVFLGAPRSDGAQEVVALRQNLRPWIGFVPYVRGARGAVEVSAGSVAGSGLRVGDHVTLAPAA